MRLLASTWFLVAVVLLCCGALWIVCCGDPTASSEDRGAVEPAPREPPAVLPEPKWDPSADIPHLESTSPAMRAKIDNYVEWLFDPHGGRDSLDAKEALIAIGKPAFPRILGRMAKARDEITDGDSEDERRLKPSLKLADEALREMDGWLWKEDKPGLGPGSTRDYIRYVCRVHYERWEQKLKHRIEMPGPYDPSDEYGEDPQGLALPEDPGKHLWSRFQSERMQKTLEAVLADLAHGAPPARREAIGYLWDLADEKLAEWLLTNRRCDQMTMNALTSRAVTGRDIVPIGRAMRQLAWPDGVEYPVEGDADDPTQRITILAGLFARAAAVTTGGPRKGPDGYYHQTAILDWIRGCLNTAVDSTEKTNRTRRAWLAYCRAAIEE